METVFRVTFVYLFILLGLRILGKREFSKLSALDLITLLLVPELVASAIIRDDYSLTNALVAVATLFCLVFLVSIVAHRFRGAERLFNGAPSLLVARGKILFRNCDRERISVEELFAEMHKSGLESLEQVRWAILEVDGKISIVPER
ncbi:MAG: DUF421 domain-containing protein [Magnetospirillum sp.]|nr:DUF421 domain-containing protein [Magnetospirillum sp.]